ncbi:MAG: hypothetical protein HYX41_04640 [Bdellovibrio sp.]|nr:hypothetical protein [Bdellovibrio sp.]
MLPQMNKSSYDNWFLKINDPTSQRALWLRFSALVSSNGFRRVADNLAIYSQRTAQDEVKKTALKQSYDLSASERSDPEPSIRTGDCSLTPVSSHGTITSKGSTISWDLTFAPSRQVGFEPIPERFQKIGLIRNSFRTPFEDVAVSGRTTLNGETFHWKDAPGMLGHRSGVRNPYSWTWGHCNTFKDEQGNYSDFIFEGLSARFKLGPFVTPPASAFFFSYRGTEYVFNSLRRLLQIKSNHSLNEWTFEAGKDDLSFRGYLKAEHKDFAGLSFEDTNGSLLYSSNSLLSNMRILVYRSGKLEATLQSQGSAAFEIASRERNPYVPLIF